MYIKNFQIENFKGLSSLELSFHPKYNFITGFNGKGKTSLLESLYTVMTSYSFSRQSDKDLVQKGSTFYRLYAHIIQKEMYYKVSLEYDLKKQKKQYLIDGKKIAAYKVLLEQFPITFFVPLDIYTIIAEPLYRRIFFDRMISYLEPEYFKSLKEYQKILKERNYILKQKELSLLEVWNKRFFDTALSIIKKRLYYIDLLNKRHKENYFIYPSFLDHLNIEYKGPKTEEDLLLIMKKKEKDEILKGTTLLGPHRDDYLITDTKNEKLVKYFFSLGQIKWLSFYLKLLEISLMNEKLNIKPPFLIDDIYSELDEYNQEAILKNIAILPNQIFSTSIKVPQYKNVVKSYSIFNFQDKGIIALNQ